MSKKITLVDELEQTDIDLTTHLQEEQFKSTSIIQDLINQNKLLGVELLKIEKGCLVHNDSQQIPKLKAEIETLKATIRKLTQQHDEISVNIHELNKSVQSAPKLFCAIQRRVSLTSNHQANDDTECCCAETSELHHLKKQMMFLNEEIGEYEENQLNLQQENERLNEEIQTLNQQIQTLSQEREKDQKQMKAQIYALEMWEKRYKTLQQEHETETEELKDFYEGLQNSLIEERAKVQQLQAANDDLYKVALNGKNLLQVHQEEEKVQLSPPRSITLAIPTQEVIDQNVLEPTEEEQQSEEHYENHVERAIKILKKKVMNHEILRTQINKQPEEVSVSLFREPFQVNHDPADIYLDPLPHQKIEDNMKKRVLPGKINPLFLLKLTQKIAHRPKEQAEKEQAEVQLLDRPLPKSHKPRRSLMPEVDLQ